MIVVFNIANNGDFSLPAIPKFHLISWGGNFVEIFLRVSGDLLETLRFHKISTPQNLGEITVF